MPKSIFDISNPTKVVRRDKREELDKMFVEVNPNPGKNRKHAVVVIHETGLGIRGDIVMTCKPVVKEDLNQLTFITCLRLPVLK